MTAITSIVSTVNPNGLTLSDIRGVVSMSYGNSPIETQQNIFNLVKSAWENDRKVAVGQSLTSVDHERTSSLFVPSKYEQQMESRRSQVVPAGATKTPSKRLVGRAELIQAVRSQKSASSRSQTSTFASIANEKGAAEESFKWLDLSIWFQLIAPPSEEWQRHMEGALKGFDEDGSFKYGQITGGRSGSAICFQCKISANPAMFDLAVSYCNDTILPALRKAEYLSSNVSSMALQYSHPTTDKSGHTTTVIFKQNSIKNSTDDVITFHSSSDSTTLLILQPKEENSLTGSVSYISSSAPVTPQSQQEGEAKTSPAKAPTNEPNGTDKKEGGDATAPNVPPKFGKIRDYVTYENITPQDIITSVPATLQKLPSGGYQIELRDPRDELMQIRYNSLWPTSE